MKYAVCFLLVLTCGCMSDKQWEDTRIMHMQYMSQQRTFKSVELKGDNMTITMTGVTSLTTEAPLNPLTTMPQYPDFAKDILDGAKTVAGYAALGYIGAKAVDNMTVAPKPTPVPTQ